MGIIRKFNQSRHLFFVGTLLLLFLSFGFNIFGVGVNESWFANFEQGSEAIIKKTAECKGEQNFYSGPLMYRDYQNGARTHPETCSQTYLMPYGSQYGLQARVVSLFAPADNSMLDRYFKYAELVLAFLTATLFALFANKIRRQYGIVAAGVLVILVSISPWIVGYARNLYWVLPLLIAPFILTYCIYDKLKIRWQYLAFYLAITILFTLKMLDGYEHITTMAVSVLAAIAYYEFRSFKSLFRDILHPMFFVGASSIFAFGFAFAINVVGLNEYYHSIDKSIDAISQRAEARGGSISSISQVQPNVIYALKATLPDVYNAIDYYHSLDSMTDGKSNPILYFAISAMNYTLLPGVNIPLGVNGIFGVLIQSVLFLGILGHVAVKRVKNKNRDRLLVGARIGLLGALSWLILMPAHAYPHAFLNGIIFYVPFLLFVYVIFGAWLSECVDKKAKRRA